MSNRQLSHAAEEHKHKPMLKLPNGTRDRPNWVESDQERWQDENRTANGFAAKTLKNMSDIIVRGIRIVSAGIHDDLHHAFEYAWTSANDVKFLA